MYYSNDILSRVVPREAAAYTSLGITVLNAIMTFPPIFLVDVSVVSNIGLGTLPDLLSARSELAANHCLCTRFWAPSCLALL